MRLIDADKLMERLKINSIIVTYDGNNSTYGLTLSGIEKVIKELEAHVEPERKKGKWLLSDEQRRGVRRMTDELMLIFGDDGIAREYKDDFDITIHCESKEEQEETWKRLTQDWTPCSKELPKEDGDYLVTLEKGYAEDYGSELVIIMNFEVDCESFGYWYESFDPHTLGSLGSDWREIPVTAWMPLPEPFRGEQE